MTSVPFDILLQHVMSSAYEKLARELPPTLASIKVCGLDSWHMCVCTLSQCACTMGVCVCVRVVRMRACACMCVRTQVRVHLGRQHFLCVQSEVERATEVASFFLAIRSQFARLVVILRWLRLRQSVAQLPEERRDVAKQRNEAFRTAADKLFELAQGIPNGRLDLWDTPTAVSMFRMGSFPRLPPLVHTFAADADEQGRVKHAYRRTLQV